MVKWSWVLVTSTHVIDSLKCASVVWAAWLVPITPCSNQSVQTAITRGWDGRVGSEMVEGTKWADDEIFILEWQKANPIWVLVTVDITVFHCFCREWNIYTYKAAELDRILALPKKHNSWFKLELTAAFYVFKLHQQCVLHLSRCKRLKNDKRHDPTVIS